jgi:hypothetical protein
MVSWEAILVLSRVGAITGGARRLRGLDWSTIAYEEWPASPHLGQAAISYLLAVLRGHYSSRGSR